MNLSEFSAANAYRCDNDYHHPFPPEGTPTRRHDSWSPSDWMTAIAGEVGEAANLIKKRRRGQEIDTKDILHELADAVIYIDLLVTALGGDLETAIREKFNLTSDRIGSTVKV